MTQAANADTVQLHYTGKLKDGTVFDSSEDRDPIEFKIGAHIIIPKLEDSVIGMSVGDKASVEITCEEAYGPRHEDAVQTVDRSIIPGDTELTIGKQLQATDQEGQPHMLIVVAVEGDTVTLDGNHPLAGEDLFFEIELVKILADTC